MIWNTAIQAAAGVSERLPLLVKGAVGVWAAAGLPFLFFDELRQGISPVALVLISLPAILFFVFFILLVILKTLEDVSGPLVRLIRKRKADG